MGSTSFARHERPTILFSASALKASPGNSEIRKSDISAEIPRHKLSRVHTFSTVMLGDALLELGGVADIALGRRMACQP